MGVIGQIILTVLIFAIWLIIKSEENIKVILKILLKNMTKVKGSLENIFKLVIEFLRIMLPLFGFMLLLNLIIIALKKLNLGFVSELGYNETQTMLASALVAGYVAFFQHRIQNILNQKNKYENEQINKWHTEEIEGEHLNSLINKENIKCIGINAYFNNTKIYLPDLCEVPVGYKIKISSENKNGLFRIDSKVIISNVYIENDRKQIEVEFKRNPDDSIIITLDDGFTDFFMYPLSVKNITSIVDKPIIIIIKGTLENNNINCYYKNEKNNDSEYKSLKFEFEWSFTVIPDGGYIFNGIFPLKIVNTNCQKIK